MAINNANFVGSILVLLTYLLSQSDFQPLLPRTLTHPNEIRIIYSHTLARSPRKISARSAHRGPSNRPQCRPTRVKNGENCRFFYGFSTAVPTYVNAHQRN